MGTDISSLFARAHELLSIYEPSLLYNLPGIAKAVVYFFVAFIGVRLTVGLARLVCTLFFHVVRSLLRSVGRAIDEIDNGINEGLTIEQFCPELCVKLEAFLYRTGLLWLDDDDSDYDDEGERKTGDKPEDGEPTVKRNTPAHITNSTDRLQTKSASTIFRASGVLLTTIRISTLVVSSFIAIAVALPSAFVRVVFEHKIVTAFSLAFTLWYTGSFETIIEPINGAIREISWGDFRVSTLLAIGTLVAIIYAALNSDVRGRAEVNKNASVACRTAMLQAVRSLEEIALWLRIIRAIGIGWLRTFPTDTDLTSFSGRNDLVWRGGRLLPERANRVPHDFRSHSILQRTFINDLIDTVDNGTTKRPPRASLVEGHDMSTAVQALHDSCQVAQKLLDDLREIGFYSKLDRVVGRLGAKYIENLQDHKFGIKLLPDLSAPWWNTRFVSYVAGLAKKEFDELATNEDDPDSPQLRDACKVLQEAIRDTRTSAYHTYWQLGLDEAKIKWVIHQVDTSLRPKMWERIRQFFGK